MRTLNISKARVQRTLGIFLLFQPLFILLFIPFFHLKRQTKIKTMYRGHMELFPKFAVLYVCMLEMRNVSDFSSQYFGYHIHISDIVLDIRKAFRICYDASPNYHRASCLSRHTRDRISNFVWQSPACHFHDIFVCQVEPLPLYPARVHNETHCWSISLGKDGFIFLRLIDDTNWISNLVEVYLKFVIYHLLIF